MKGMRINKYLSEAGICSRREADALVDEGRVTINGEVAALGTQIMEGDAVAVDGEPVVFDSVLDPASRGFAVNTATNV